MEPTHKLELSGTFPSRPASPATACTLQVRHRDDSSLPLFTSSLIHLLLLSTVHCSLSTVHSRLFTCDLSHGEQKIPHFRGAIA